MNVNLSLAASRRVLSSNAVCSEVLFVTECSAWGELGYETVSAAFPSVLPVYWSPEMPKPDFSGWHGDWIISFKSDLILSRAILERAKKGAINFHPSPPKYRGVGGYWWALHNGDDVFGVTCHHMNERIDHGAIITIESFPIWPGEIEESLKHRTAINSLSLLNEMLDVILCEKPLAPCGAKWGRHLYTYRELALAQSAHAANGDRRSTQPVNKSLDARPALEALEALIEEDFTVPSERRGKNAATRKQFEAFWKIERDMPQASHKGK
jgi:phosphoribosylglycinamide formyltransferase 1